MSVTIYWADLCLAAVLAGMVGASFAIGAWAALFIPVYLLGGISFKLYESRREGA